MNRSDLERLDRDTLIARAEQSGVPRARILTRPELVDELLSRAGISRPEEVVRMRGLFGRARDLLTRVIEKGLHLPDAAERLRERLSIPSGSQEPPLPTVTLAEIYASQGHKARAIATLRDILAQEPDHIPAGKLLARLTDVAYEGPESPMLPPEDEIFAVAPADVAEDEVDEAPIDEAAAELLAEAFNGDEDATELEPDDVELVEEDEDEEDDDVTEEAPALDIPRARTARDDECVAIPVDRETLFVHWDVSDDTRDHLLRARPGGALVLRALIVAPTWDGPKSSVRDRDLTSERGDTMLEDLPAGAVVRAAVGWQIGTDLFPIAHAPALEALEIDDAGAVRTVARWTPRGFVHVDPEDRDAAAIERAFEAIRVRASAE